MLENQKKRLSEQHEQLQSLNKSMTLNLSSKKEYSMFYLSVHVSIQNYNIMTNLINNSSVYLTAVKSDTSYLNLPQM